MLLGDTGNGNGSQAATLNQAAYDDEILALKSSDIAHGMTGITETDTYGYMRKMQASVGGLSITGLREANCAYTALELRGFAGDPLPGDHDANTNAAINLIVGLRSGACQCGTGITTIGTATNAVLIKNNTTVRWIVQGDGDVFYSGTTNASDWDTHCDVALLTAARAVFMPECADFKKRFSGFVDDHAQTLHDTGVITLNDDGNHFVSTKGMNGLIIDSIRQMHGRVNNLENQLKALQGGCP